MFHSVLELFMCSELLRAVPLSVDYTVELNCHIRLTPHSINPATKEEGAWGTQRTDALIHILCRPRTPFMQVRKGKVLLTGGIANHISFQGCINRKWETGSEVVYASSHSQGDLALLALGGFFVWF